MYVHIYNTLVHIISPYFEYNYLFIPIIPHYLQFIHIILMHGYVCTRVYVLHTMKVLVYSTDRCYFTDKYVFVNTSRLIPSLICMDVKNFIFELRLLQF